MLDDLDTDATRVRNPSQVERELGKGHNDKDMVFIRLYYARNTLYRQY
jgi:hypothetical protein